MTSAIPSDRFLLLLFLLFLTASIPLRAAVEQVEIIRREEVKGTDYELITGKLHFAIDPKLPGNALISDIALAATNAEGMVRFTSDMCLWSPKSPDRRNGAAWVEIPNRGGRAKPSPAMIEQGFVLLNVGWEFDVKERENALTLDAPRIQNQDGTPIRGVVSAQLTPLKASTAEKIQYLPEYPPVDINGPDSRLIVRPSLAYPDGNEVPRSKWTLQDNLLQLEGGFEPGLTYELFYLSEAPVVAGLGYAAIRDAVAWLKHDPESLAPIQYAYAFGSSQCGRLLRDFVYLGFNTDERDRIALDGVLSHVAGAGRLVLNERWSTPRDLAAFRTTSYPFADTAQFDPVSGHKEGIVANPRVKHAPKIFYTNTASEYWGGGRVAALTHTDAAGREDVDFPDNVRSYFFAGTSHGPAPFPPAASAADAPLADPINATPVVAALREAMHLWVSKNIDPPASVYPKFRDGTLTPVAEVRFPKVPGIASPNAVRAGLRLHNPIFTDGAGGGTELPLLVPQVDEDGNDLGGIRMPDLAVPLATASGWVFRSPSQGATDELVILKGAWTPLAATKAQRERNQDPRLSLEERYASKDEFMAKVKLTVEQLIEKRLLQAEDLAPQMTQASTRWDWVVEHGNSEAP